MAVLSRIIHSIMILKKKETRKRVNPGREAEEQQGEKEEEMKSGNKERNKLRRTYRKEKNHFRIERSTRAKKEDGHQTGGAKRRRS